jgi:hypothetical protein
MRIVKYVIQSNGIPLIFNTKIVFLDNIKKVISSGNKVVSAGIAIIYYDETNEQFMVKCYGESSYLNIAFKEADCILIQNFLNDRLNAKDFDEIFYYN